MYLFFRLNEQPVGDIVLPRGLKCHLVIGYSTILSFRVIFFQFVQSEGMTSFFQLIEGH